MDSSERTSVFSKLAVPASLLGAMLSLFVFVIYFLRPDYRITSYIVGIFASLAGALFAYLFSYVVPRRRPRRVFLSYAETDKDAVKKLQSALLDSGFRVFTADDAVLVGESIADKINDAISSADSVVLVLSANAVQSEWVRRELAKARELKKRLYPVLIEDVELPEELAGIRFADFRTDADHQTKLLVKSIREHSRAESE